MKQVVITGATSMLGLALIDECLYHNTGVLAVVRRTSQKRKLLPKSNLLKIEECDLCELGAWQDISSDAYDAFYHFAWEATGNQSRNFVDAQYRNVLHTLNAVKLSHRMGCRKFIGAGSQAEYGRVEGIISPELRVAPDSAYGITKYAAGRLSGILAQQLGVDFIWMRIFSIYGVGDMPSTMVMYCIDQLLRGKKPQLTQCEQQWDYLNCRDAAKAFYLIGNKGRSGAIYNIGSGKTRQLSEYVFSIRDLIDPNLPLGIGERIYAPMQVMHLCPDISSLQADTDFVPSVSFEDGIRETIDWYRKKNPPPPLIIVNFVQNNLCKIWVICRSAIVINY
jgi:nucleoside-diphosphate-sugar epimerase